MKSQADIESLRFLAESMKNDAMSQRLNANFNGGRCVVKSDSLERASAERAQRLEINLTGNRRLA